MVLPMYRATIGQRRYVFGDLKTLLAKASPARSGDRLAGVAAESFEERVAAQYALADLPLATFLHEHVVAYETDEVTRLIGADFGAFFGAGADGKSRLQAISSEQAERYHGLRELTGRGRYRACGIL